MNSGACRRAPLMKSLQEFQSQAIVKPPIRRTDDLHHPPQNIIPKPFDPTSPVERSSILYNIDRIITNVRFDFSCLDAIDDDLFQNPTDSFVELCWMQSVEEDEHPAENVSLVSDTSSSFDDGQTIESDYTPTMSSDAQWHEGFIHPSLPEPKVYVLPLPLDKQSSSLRINIPNDDKESSFMILDTPLIKFPVPDPSQSIHFFPTVKRDLLVKVPPSSPFTRIYNRLPGLVRWAA